MAAIAVEHGAYVEDFERREPRWASGGGAWFLPVRKAAIARFAEAGFPTTRDEEWRLTNVAPIAATVFRQAEAAPESVTTQDLAPWLLDEAAARLVFVNGHFSRALSRIDYALGGIRVGRLAVAIDETPTALVPYLGRCADCRRNPFVALNTAFLDDGALVRIPPGRTVSRPIQVLYVSLGADGPVLSHPRTLLVAGADSQATLVESYVGLGGGSHLSNAVTEVYAGANASVEHTRIVSEADAFHVGSLCLRQERDSRITAHSITLEGSLVRNDVHAVLDGEGADCSLDGLFFLGGRQHADNHLHVEHVSPRAGSRECYRGILDGASRGVFSGRIHVHKGAQKTDAKQTNMNLLLSREAHVDTKPQLEIFANDVKCTHGATIGQIDEEAVFYLRSRGIGRDAARNLLVFAFADEILRRIGVTTLRERLRHIVAGRLAGAKRIEVGR